MSLTGRQATKDAITKIPEDRALTTRQPRAASVSWGTITILQCVCRGETAATDVLEGIEMSGGHGITTARILADRALQKPCGQECVD